MTTPIRIVSLFLSAFFIAACGSSVASEAEPDVAIGLGGFDVTDTTTDGDADDVGDDAGDVEGDVVVVQDAGTDAARVGLFGDACTSNDECVSRFCIEGFEGGRICSERCFDDCPYENYECRLLAGSGGDLQSICYPRYDDLCRACTADRQCGGLADQCLTLFDGQFCGRECSSNAECPDLFVCKSMPEGGGQCAPDNDTCSDCIDGDNDGYGEGRTCIDLDCDDTDGTVHPFSPELCDLRDNDCDSTVDEDFDLDTNSQHCGACNNVCALPNAESSCNAGACFVTACRPFFHDLNGRPSDGCEYFCEFEDPEAIDGTNPDRPDPLYRDTNCDGLDGDATYAVFVSPTGNDTAAGTREAPFRTLTRGMEVAAAEAFVTSVYVSEGQYFGALDPATGDNLPFQFVNGVNVYGGFEALTWERGPGNSTRIAGSNIAAIAENITEPTELGSLEIVAADGRTTEEGYGAPSIALLVRDAEGLTLSGCALRSGVGGNGATGTTGVVGGGGGVGGPGNTGTESSSGACSDNPAPAVGARGASPCGNLGGAGGSAGRAEGNGGTGGAGGGPSPGTRGTGGRGGDNGTFGGVDRAGAVGTAGGPGAAGSPGEAGAGGLAAGSLVSDMWRVGGGASGGAGTAGSGGGGGGGGGGAPGGCGDLTGICDGYGGSGGGGGGGGCGGAGGGPGFPGGGSFPLYAIDSDVITVRSTFTAGNGGAGGAGGAGGPAGPGGAGGLGGGTACSGGVGSAGGSGGGGAGGPSYGAVSVNSTIESTESAFFFAVGGQGGVAPNPGERGPRGEIRNFD